MMRQCEVSWTSGDVLLSQEFCPVFTLPRLKFFVELQFVKRLFHARAILWAKEEVSNDHGSEHVAFRMLQLADQL